MIRKTENNTLKLSPRDYLCSLICKSNNIKTLNVVEKFVNKKTSIESLLKTAIEFDKMKSVLFSTNENKAMSLVDLVLMKNKKNELEIREPWTEKFKSSALTGNDFEELVKVFDRDDLNYVEERIYGLVGYEVKQ